MKWMIVGILAAATLIGCGVGADETIDPQTGEVYQTRQSGLENSPGGASATPPEAQGAPTGLTSSYTAPPPGSSNTNPTPGVNPDAPIGPTRELPQDPDPIVPTRPGPPPGPCEGDPGSPVF